jgi:D-tyrosyl-tRNA(Tyr) deacylase
MIALVQRVSRAQVRVADQVRGWIDRGLLVFVCAEPADRDEQAARLVDKVLKLRVFADEAGKMNRSVQDVNGGILIVSQFTLAADTAGGNRPSFSGAAPPALGRALYDTVLRLAHERHPAVQAGEFGAEMQVELINDGPVTIPLRVV